jgi:hypothetical protein
MFEPKASILKKRTRRNIIRAGAILASAVVANVAPTRRASADHDHDHDSHDHDSHGHDHLSDSASAASTISTDSQCLLRGTTIQTASGNRKIEHLAVGDLLPTMFGGQRPIQWIARYPFRKSDPSKPWVKAVRPVRVARSALALDVPHADLYLTEWHARFVDGVLIPVGSLINGTTIKRYEARELSELEFFNIKLESHDVIYRKAHLSRPCWKSTNAQLISPSICANTELRELTRFVARQLLLTVVAVN